LNQQMGLLGKVRQEISRGRSLARDLAPSQAKLKMIVGVIVGIVALGGVIFLIRRKRRAQGGEKPEVISLRTIDLYKRLERVLDSLGLSRPLTTPPLRHAQAIVGAGHPLGEEILALTNLYVRTRFGGEPLTKREEQDFLARVTALKAKNAVERAQAERAASA